MSESHPKALGSRTGRLLLGCAIALSLGCGVLERGDSTEAELPPAAADTPASDGDAATPTKADPELGSLAGVLDRAIEAPPEGGNTYRVDAYLAALIVDQLRRDPLPFTSWRGDPSETAKPELGYRVGPLAADSVWARLGLAEGDIVHEVNGARMTDAGWISAALARGENQVTVTVFREDLSFVLSYRLMGGLAWDAIRVEHVSPVAIADATIDPEPAEPDAPIGAPNGGIDPTPPSGVGAGAGGGSRGGSSRGGDASGKTPSSRPSSGGSAPKPKASGVARCASASRCTIDKPYFDSLVRSPSKIESQANIVPAIRNDVHSGYKLKTVRSGTAVSALGFRAGDKITHINGRDLTDEYAAMQLYLGLSSMRSFRVRYVRGGSTRTKTIDVVNP